MFPTLAFEAKNKSSIKIIQRILDFAMLMAAFTLAYLLRFDFSLTADEAQKAFLQLLFVVPFQFSVLRLCNVHKFIWRYVSLPEMNRILMALAAAALPLLMLRFCLPDNLHLAIVPFSIIILDFLLAIIAVVGIRLLRREIYENMRRAETSAANTEKKSILLIGAGRAGVMTLTEIKNRHDCNFDIKGFIDDDSAKLGSVINGIEVIGKTENIPHLVRNLDIDHIIITIAEASREDFQRILQICKSVPIKVKTIPGLYELLQEKVIFTRIRDVEVEDLLGRSIVSLDEQSIKRFLSGKTVLVTGAGGSIGSELARQLMLCQISKLVLVERSEFGLFEIEREIIALHPTIEIVAVIADVCDENRMRRVFERYQPQIVFHAAAHKHVPMMEHNAAEALKNNVLGTNTVGRLAGHYRAEGFVLISTDKAVNPSSVMGATKRVAELVIQDLNDRFATRYVAVRFGNVIGSNGSVIPTFKKQIKKGGPVTVTHPEMTRYFMTIPEASQLVLQAGALGKGGEIFILDMGEPVKILDLAKETIRLSGLKPDEDIQIVFTGMRPGEKLSEELETDQERLTKTTHSKIFIAQIAPYPREEIKKALTTVEQLCFSDNDSMIRRFLIELLPEARLEIKAAQPKLKTQNKANTQIYNLAS
ncbi:MAG: nucleoside-diphosphate sugar epimerase/dehydratase [Actinomycetota bacterium]